MSTKQQTAPTAATPRPHWLCDKVHVAIPDDLCAAFHYHGGQPITVEDVARVDREWTSGTDEPDFAWLLELRDGRWASASGGHDYTGWDCQSYLHVRVFATRDEAIRMGLTLNDRENLGLLLPGESLATQEQP